MKGLKLGILGICISLLGTSFATNNILAISCAALGLLLALMGCFVKDPQR